MARGSRSRLRLQRTSNLSRHSIGIITLHHCACAIQGEQICTQTLLLAPSGNTPHTEAPYSFSHAWRRHCDYHHPLSQRLPRCSRQVQEPGRDTRGALLAQFLPLGDQVALLLQSRNAVAGLARTPTLHQPEGAVGAAATNPALPQRLIGGNSLLWLPSHFSLHQRCTLKLREDDRES